MKLTNSQEEYLKTIYILEKSSGKITGFTEKDDQKPFPAVPDRTAGTGPVLFLSGLPAKPGE